MLAFVSAAEFDPRIYVELEEFLKGKGEMDFATRVFLERNDRFRDERAHGVNWWSRYLLGIVAGYGRAPERSLIPCALVVLFGCFVFWDDRKMKPNEQKFEGRRYNPLWYSLDLFAPIIDLEAAKVWSPLPTETFKWFYFRLQRILGWLLVPIAIAAFTGFLHT
jgi:hypothetical protein